MGTKQHGIKTLGKELPLQRHKHTEVNSEKHKETLLPHQKLNPWYKDSIIFKFLRPISSDKGFGRIEGSSIKYIYYYYNNNNKGQILEFYSLNKGLIIIIIVKKSHFSILT